MEHESEFLAYGDVQVYRHDLETLSPGEWLNDTIIEFHLERLERDEFKEEKQSIHFLRPGIAYFLASYADPTELGIDLKCYDLVVIPVNNNSGNVAG